MPVVGEASSEPILKVESLLVVFEKLIAVRNVNLALPAGCLLGLVGPNGAGKTTLLRAIAGLQQPTRGMIHVIGERVAPGNHPALRQLGFAPDNPPMYDELTVRQFLKMIGKGYDLQPHEADERIDFWLEKVWLTEKANSKVGTLSRGMRQRVGIARTLMPNPAVILLDEPAAGLDPAGRVQFRQLLSNLRDQGKALIVSSHILADMDEYCSHIAIMSAGEIVQYGTVAQIAARAHSDDGRCRYTIVLAHPVPHLEQIFGQIAEVSDIRVDTNRLTIAYPMDRELAARLLSELINKHKLPVASFSANPAGLEEAYLRTGIRQVD